jgi:hypothetical protein
VTSGDFCVSVCIFLLSLQGKDSVKCTSIPPSGANRWENTFPRQRMYTTIKEMLDPSFYMGSMSVR